MVCACGWLVASQAQGPGKSGSGILPHAEANQYAIDTSIQPLLTEPETDAMGHLPAGYVIAGKYRIEKVIGSGGMAVVHEATHMRLGERVAIKVMRPATMGIPGMLVRFLHEARAASRVKSEHVCRVLDTDTLPSGLPYIVLEYLDGIDLGELRRQVGVLPIADAIRYVVEACDTIAETHRLGIVHRDLKPSNLFLANWRDGRRMIKVLDFGISKIESAEEPDPTQAGMALGTPHYMSPEQMQSARDADGRTDIWGLGACLYLLLAGRPPFKAERLEQVCRLVLHGDPPPLVSLRPEVPPEVDAIVQRCLRKNPDERFATADDLARSLLPFCEPSAATTPGPARVRQESQSDKQKPPADAWLEHRLEPTKPETRISAPPMLQWSAERRIPKRSWGTNVAVVAAVCVANLVFFGRNSGERTASAQAGEVEENRPVTTDAPVPVTPEPNPQQWMSPNVPASAGLVTATFADESATPAQATSNPPAPVSVSKPVSHRASAPTKTRPIVLGVTTVERVRLDRHGMPRDHRYAP